jgi:hypothetical protein
MNSLKQNVECIQTFNTFEEETVETKRAFPEINCREKNYPIKLRPIIENILFERIKEINFTNPSKYKNAGIKSSSGGEAEAKDDFSETNCKEISIKFTNTTATEKILFIINSHPCSTINWYFISGNPSAVHILERYKHKLCTLCWLNISKNPNAISLIENNLEKVDWPTLCFNPNAIHILKKNKDKINWDNLAMNPAAMELILENMDKINWKYLSQNPSAIEIIKNNMDKVYWYGLCKNPAAIEILEENQSNINYYCLAENSAAIHLIEKNIEKISYGTWLNLSKNPNAISILKKNKQLINWVGLAENPNALEILEDPINIRKITPVYLLKNPAIFTYDYDQMNCNISIIKEELMKSAWKPSRVIKWIEDECDDMLC